MSAVLDVPLQGSADRRFVHWELWTGGTLLSCIVLLALIGPGLAAHDARFIDLDQRFLPPFSRGFALGSDQLGRDLVARILHGLRWSFATALCATLIASSIGTALGLLAGRSRSFLGKAIRQATALAQSFPVFVLAVSLVAIVGSGFMAIATVLGLVTWPVFCRVVQAEAQSLFTREYVLAAEMLQMSPLRLYFRHVLPGLVASLSVLVPFHFADMLIAESALSFLGIGAPLGAATWGNMLQESRSYLLNAPWIMLPGGAGTDPVGRGSVHRYVAHASNRTERFVHGWHRRGAGCRR
jgi:peptide/nickel transport system permease protein